MRVGLSPRAGIALLRAARAWAMLQGRDHVLPGEVASENEIPRGSGAIVRHGLKEIAAYRDEEGTLHTCSAVCTHAGCVVHWNSTENSWDCPCHGSRFDPHGQVLNGPAVSALHPVEEGSDVDASAARG